MNRLKVISVLMTVLLLAVSLSTGCGVSRSFDGRLKAITQPYRFSIAGWEFGAIISEIKKAIGNDNPDCNVDNVTDYFGSTEQINKLRSEIRQIDGNSRQGDVTSLEAELARLRQQNESLTDSVERTIEGQIREVFSQQGIFNPLSGIKFNFPPVNFRLAEPLQLLVVSPRDRIESIREIILQPGISLKDIEKIEAEADSLGVSSLVVGLGGFAGTYPTFVTSEADLRFIIDAAAEEWLHQYLTFKPLGFRYLLDLTGLSRNYEVATIAETVTSMVSKEIGAIIYKEYYAGEKGEEAQPPKSGFDFNREMRETRKAVDEYLAKGEVEQAEAFMEQKRQYLASNGYYIRKLNQAYFAFHDTYADRPTSVSPIGQELKELRSRSSSLKEFLETAASLTSRQDIIYTLDKSRAVAMD